MITMLMTPGVAIWRSLLWIRLWLSRYIHWLSNWSSIHDWLCDWGCHNYRSNWRSSVNNRLWRRLRVDHLRLWLLIHDLRLLLILLIIRMWLGWRGQGRSGLCRHRRRLRRNQRSSCCRTYIWRRKSFTFEFALEADAAGDFAEIVLEIRN